MSRKLVMSLAAAVMISSMPGAITADATALQYHGGPKVNATVSTGGSAFGSVTTEDAGWTYTGGPKSATTP
jgi:hypothetical protein